MKCFHLTGIELLPLLALMFGGITHSLVRICQQCMEFVILTHEYRKSVLDATVDKPKAIPDLVKQYSQYVLQLFNSSNPL